MFPIGLGYISSILKTNGYNVTCLNLNHHDGTISDILKKELVKSYDIICTGHVGGTGYSITKEIIDSTREYSPKSKIIIGGALITSEPTLMFDSLKPDIGVLGEGETTIIDLLKTLENNKDLRKVDGIIYKSGDEIIQTKPREPIKNINSLPFPDFESFGYTEYLENLYTNQEFPNNLYDYPRAYPLLCSRSCPFQCTFCYHPIGRKYRERSIDNIMKELEVAVRKYKINVINIYDDMLSYKKERLYELCKRIKLLSKETPQELKWSCQLSVIDIDKDLLKVMKDSGCSIISYGFESFSPEVLKSMKKPITPEQIDIAFKMTVEAGISVQANFIFGDVAETNETAKATLDYWEKNCRGQVSLVFIQAYPSSELYQHCVRKGIIKDKLDFIKNHTGNLILNMTDKMSDEEVHKLYNNLQKLESKYKQYITPSKVVKLTKDRYEVHINCPFCHENLVYKNYYFQNRILYRSWLICRKCGMRFFVSSPLMNFLKNYSSLSTFLEKKIRWVRQKLKLYKL
jgi:anaerobic magnesium-protoporphyrin IX monomethyl ester cyclase